MNILVPNLGSTSLKFQLLEMPAERILSRGRFERVSDYAEAIRRIDAGGAPIDAVALKAVHGGPQYCGTYLVDDGVIAAMQTFLPAAPAHNAINLTAIRAFKSALPGAPIVAAFETEFHVSMPEFARTYGAPSTWSEWAALRKYGFHGASHQYVSERVPAMLAADRGRLRLISCHLGGSSSICAISGGRSLDTTMGFSPQSGLENATRHGDLDVFAVLFQMERSGWDVAETRRQLATTAGLAGISGIAGGDIRDLEAAAAAGNAQAELALAVFAYQIKKTIGAYTAAMTGVDAIAFTGGIGENSATLRRSCCERLEFMGVHLDPVRNKSGSGERVISPEGAPVILVALPTNEEIVVARRAYRILSEDRFANESN